MTYNERYVYILNDLLDREINDLESVVEILTDENSIIDSDSVSSDVKVMLNRINMFKDFRNMIIKASLEIKDIDNEVMMTTKEKKIFLWIIRKIIFVRRLFNRKK